MINTLQTKHENKSLTAKSGAKRMFRNCRDKTVEYSPADIKNDSYHSRWLSGDTK